MRVLVCGGRDFNDWDLFWKTMFEISKKDVITTIIHGNAKGADSFAAEWGKSFAHEVLAYPADWKTHGKSAGPIRNQKMLDEGKPDLVIAFPGGRGTAHMVKIAREAKIEVIEI